MLYIYTEQSKQTVCLCASTCAVCTHGQHTDLTRIEMIRSRFQYLGALEM